MTQVYGRVPESRLPAVAGNYESGERRLYLLEPQERSDALGIGVTEFVKR